MPKIQPRPLSPGEISELKRAQQWAMSRKQVHTKPGSSTFAVKPPTYWKGSEWSPENT
jgi:hypothetical protein